MPSTQYVSCKTTKKLKLWNRQARPSSWNKTLPIPFWSLPLPLCGFKSLPAPFPGWLVRKPTFREMVFLPFEKSFLPLSPLDHQAQSSCDHHSGCCACSSPRNALSVHLNPPSHFPFAFSSLHLATFCSTVWTARYSRSRPMSKNATFHHQCNLAHQLLRLWPFVQIRLQHNLLR